MTFSIIAVDPERQEIGVAVQSKFLAAGAVVPWARAGVGAVATQSFTDVTFGDRGLELLRSGKSPDEVLSSLLEGDPQRKLRQVGIVAADGRSATFTGAECLEWAGGSSGPGYAVQGNILAGPGVVDGLLVGFQRTPEQPLARRLVEALREAQRAGGDRRGQEAAGLLVVAPNAGYGGNHDRMIDLRVDHHDQPIEELAKLLDIHQLLFGRTAPDDELPVVAPLLRQVGEHLRTLGRAGDDADDKDLWRRFYDWVLMENLEERWLGDERVDRVVLDHLRAQADRARPATD
jgi:uncharacterized Ntn-hydrolase superfamily protein